MEYTAAPDLDEGSRRARLLKAISAPKVHMDATFVLALIAATDLSASGWAGLWPAYRNHFQTPDSTAQFAVWTALNHPEQARLACNVDHGLRPRPSSWVVPSPARTPSESGPT